MSLPILYHRGKSGKLHQWRVWTQDDAIFSEAGQVDGKKILSQKKATPKNIGRANATTANEQAVIEMNAMHKFKLDRKYALTQKDAKEIDLQPMLAQSFEKRKGKISYPLDVQPKLDGVRGLCMWEDERIVLLSRGNKEWNVVTHIIKELEDNLPKGYMLDGEIFIKGVGFQTLASWVKRSQPNTIKLEYHCYDMPLINGDDSLPWEERRKHLEKFFKKSFKHLRLVESHEANNEEDVLRLHDEFVADGYEGAIGRSHKGLYEFSYRSYDLLKVKSFSDEEFRIVGVTNGKGKFETCAILICETESGKTFQAVPKATQEQKEHMLKNAKQLIGTKATVAYFGLTDEGLPRFPVAKIRPKEDLQ